MGACIKQTVPRAEAYALLDFIQYLITCEAQSGLYIIYADAKLTISGWCNIARNAAHYPMWDEIKDLRGQAHERGIIFSIRKVIAQRGLTKTQYYLSATKGLPIMRDWVRQSNAWGNNRPTSMVGPMPQRPTDESSIYAQEISSVYLPT